MAHELEPFDISDTSDFLRLAEEVHRTRTPRLVRRDNEDLVVVSPAPRAVKRRKTRPLTEDDPLFGLVGIGRSGGSGDVSTNKHQYLAEAYRTEARDDPSA